MAQSDAIPEARGQFGTQLGRNWAGGNYAGNGTRFWRQIRMRVRRLFGKQFGMRFKQFGASFGMRFSPALPTDKTKQQRLTNFRRFAATGAAT